MPFRLTMTLARDNQRSGRRACNGRGERHRYGASTAHRQRVARVCSQGEGRQLEICRRQRGGRAQVGDRHRRGRRAGRADIDAAEIKHEGADRHLDGAGPASGRTPPSSLLPAWPPIGAAVLVATTTSAAASGREDTDQPQAGGLKQSIELSRTRHGIASVNNPSVVFAKRARCSSANSLGAVARGIKKKNETAADSYPRTLPFWTEV